MKQLLFSLFFLYSIIGLSQGERFSVAENQMKEGRFSDAYEGFKSAGKQFLEQYNKEQYAFCNIRMAECRLREGKADLAAQLASRTQDYLREELKDQKDLLAYAQLVAGEAYLNLGRNDLALENFKNGETYFDQFQNLETATCYNLLGVAYWNNENKSTALVYHEKALALREQLLPINDPLIADSYNNIGLVYLGDQDLKALIFFDKALKLYQSKFGKTHPKVANCYSNMAFAHSFLKNYSEALQYLDQVSDIWSANYTGDHPNKAFTLSNKGKIMEAKGDHTKALQFQQEALQMYIRLYGGKHPEIANTYFLIGDIKQEQSRFLEAVENYQASIYANLFDQEFTTIYDQPELRNYYNADILLTSLQAKAKALEALHFEKTLKYRDLNGSLVTYELCDDLISQIRRIRLTEKDKLRLGTIANDVYQNAIRIALVLSDKTFKKEYFKEKAFTFCERSKSAVLLDAIHETKAKSYSGIPANLLALEDSLKAEIGFLERQLAGDPNVTELKSRLFDYKKAYLDFVKQLEADYPNYFQLKYSQVLTSVPELQSKLNEGTAVLSYFTATERIYIFLVTKNDFEVYDFPKIDDFQKTISAFRNGIKYRIQSTYQNAAYALFKQLIPKIPKEVDQLIFLPDGILGTLPFEAFLTESTDETTKNTSFLINTYRISYDYGATLLTERLSKSNQSGEGILLAAPITFEGNQVKMVNLPESETEVKEIKYLFTSNSNTPSPFLKKNATEGLLKSETLNQYKYIHFATHGVVNESKPELSCIFLTPEGRDDGSLYTGEIYNLKINAKLVTLSACETGLGKVTKGEGMVGLSRALLYAGAENLMVSLWQVADASTSQLMIEFYRQHLHHSQNDQFADDLRKAKFTLIQSDQYTDPYFWAPFILIGQ